jgi:hypothetical protein
VQTGQSDPIIKRSGPKQSKADVEDGRSCSGVQRSQSASVTSPTACRTRSAKRSARRSRRQRRARRPDLRLRGVIEHERWPRKRRDELAAGPEVARVDQDVVGEAPAPQNLDATQEVAAQQEAFVRFGLHDVTDADELAPPSKRASCSPTSSRRRSTQPTTPATNGWRSARSRSQRVSSSVWRACTATQAVEAGPPELRQQMLRQRSHA